MGLRMCTPESGPCGGRPRKNKSGEERRGKSLARVGSSEEKSEGLGLGGSICTISGRGPGEFNWTMSDKSAENQWNADICGIIWFSGIMPAPRARARARNNFDW